MVIYIASKIEGEEVEMLKAFYTMDSAIDYLNEVGVLYKGDDVEFTIDPLNLE